MRCGSYVHSPSYVTTVTTVLIFPTIPSKCYNHFYGRTKSSTKAELVEVDDTMTFVMWIKDFFESQVRFINVNSPLKPLGSDVTIKQDNTSAIQLERNRWKSSNKRTKHINVRYFCITDRLKAGDVRRVIYKPTLDMESDYLTKALQ